MKKKIVYGIMNFYFTIWMFVIHMVCLFELQKNPSMLLATVFSYFSTILFAILESENPKYKE